MQHAIPIFASGSAPKRHHRNIKGFEVVVFSDEIAFF
tara:strand:+ start:1322 stop:1432 length:111 start_codon:yes stop_codon:yes gene_type:complete